MSLIDTIRNTMFVKPHPAGHLFILIGAGLSIITLMISSELGLLFVALTLFVYYFFRDPVRMVPQRKGLVVAPADGRILSIKQGQILPDELSEEDDSPTYTKISIFLSVIDPHVNRVPISGKITKTFYYEGKFLNAELDKASEENERASIIVEYEEGKYIAFSQIAGLVARRIVNDLVPDQDVKTGERFGIIKFGSRMDVYLPKDIVPLVWEGQRTIAGETILADLDKQEEPRTAKAI